MTMNKWTAIYRSNLRFARTLWDSLPNAAIARLKALSKQYSLSLTHGDMQLLDGVWYGTHCGLIGIATRRHCLGIRTSVAERLSDPASSRWVFKATIYKSGRSRGFIGYGDADPSNVSPLVRGAEMRVAETR